MWIEDMTSSMQIWARPVFLEYDLMLDELAWSIATTHALFQLDNNLRL